MKKIYFSSGKKLLAAIFVMATLMFVCTNSVFSQTVKAFTQRTSSYSPTQTIYSIKGDYTMIGNKNLTGRYYNATGSNSNAQMDYVDVDGISSTLNSSSANLTLSTENGAIPECSNITYAGLYWTGRAGSSNTFTVGTKTFDKSVVYLKHANAPAYTTISASDANFTTDIYYNTNSVYGNMYAGYAEVTDYVRQYGLGSYTVADIALITGDGGSIGYFGGWSMIVVYENSAMKWRDVTIFDGFAHNDGLNPATYTLPVSGFSTTQSGQVNMKLGMMAGEGDVSIPNDFFQIIDQSSSWVPLSHSTNSTTNFFNSSINTGGNVRNPNQANNYGLDIAMFNIPNVNNSIITNSQSSTTFRYGTTQDTYIIFCIAMAVDAYRPEIEGINKVVQVNGSPYTYPGGPDVVPGDIIKYTVDIANLGTESINNGSLVIPIPYTAEFNSVSFQNYNLTGYGTPVYNASLGANGSIVWDLGTLPIPPVAGTKLATLTFTLKVTDDCKMLALATGCDFLVSIDGTIGGVGAVSGVSVSSSLIQGYESAGGQCEGLAISAPIVIPVDAVAYFDANCAGTPTTPVFDYCNTGSTIPITDVLGNFPPGSRFYSLDWSTEYTINNPFPATTGAITYNAVPPGVSAPPEDGECSYTFTINVTTLNSTPTIVSPVVYCQDEQAALLTATPSNTSYTLYYYTVPTGGSSQTSITPSTATVGTFTYYVAEGLSGACMGTRVPITVTVNPKPECSITGTDGPVCPSSSNEYAAPAGMVSYAWTISGNGAVSGASNNQTVQVIAGTACNESYTLTLITTNSYGCSQTCEKVVGVNDTENPTADALSDITLTGCNGEFPAANIEVVTGEADNCGTPMVTFVGDGEPSPTGCTETTVRTYRVTDDCGNFIDVTQNLIRTVDAENPVLTVQTEGLALGCNPEILPTEASVIAASSATDNCGTPVITAVAGEITGTCEKNQTFTVAATDVCGNNDIETVTDRKSVV